MSDELPKKVLSVPPPPTDEIDSEWGGKGADDTGKTATQAAEQGKAVASDTGAPGADAKLNEQRAGHAETAAAPSTPPPVPHAVEEEEDDEDEEEDDEDEEEEDDVLVQRVARAGHTASRGSATGAVADEDWLPDWAPWAFLALLVVIGVAGGLGAFIHSPASEAEPGTDSAKAAPAAKHEP